MWGQSFDAVITVCDERLAVYLAVRDGIRKRIEQELIPRSANGRLRKAAAATPSIGA